MGGRWVGESPDLRVQERNESGEEMGSRIALQPALLSGTTGRRDGLDPEPPYPAVPFLYDFFEEKSSGREREILSYSEFFIWKSPRRLKLVFEIISIFHQTIFDRYLQRPCVLIVVHRVLIAP